MRIFITFLVQLSLLATGAIGYADGILADEARASHTRMVGALAEYNAQQMPINPYYSDALIRSLTQRLGVLDKSSQIGRYLDTLMRLGKAQIDYGNIDAGIEQLSSIYNRMDQTKVPSKLRASVAFQLGIAYLRKAETENCCAVHAPESCILPLRGRAIHTEKAGSEAAITYFSETIEFSGDDEKLRLSAQWLLNLAYMTLGEYPEAIPAELRLPETVLNSDVPFPQFENIAGDLGLATDSLAGGTVADDFDGDGDIDLLVSSWHSGANIRYFENRLNDGFIDRTEDAGLTGILGGLNMVQADFDNDGDIDVLVLRGAWLSTPPSPPNSLLRNEGGGQFVDVTYAAGLAFQNYPTQTAAWFDFDNDGDLDVYIGNEQWGESNVPCQLFRNENDGTFTNRTRSAGVANNRICKAVVCGDIDGDRWPDIVVSNCRAENRLYHNNGDGTFTDIAAEAGTTKPLQSFPAWIWDYDNDGALDIFISSYTAGTHDFSRKALGKPFDSELSGHYRGDGKGQFTDMASEQGFDMPMLTMGSNFGDLDNDGFLDVYLGSGLPDIEQIIPNSLYLNQGGTRFADVTMASGMGHLQKGHAIAFADFDQDGDQDIFEQMGGAKRVDSFRDALYQNPGFGNHWVSLKLVGTRSNRSAIGARIHIEIEEDGKRRSIYRHVNSGASFGANPLTQHIGLGKATAIARMEVYWPTSDTSQVFQLVPADRAYSVIEGDDIKVVGR